MEATRFYEEVLGLTQVPKPVFFVEESVGSLVDESYRWVREEVGLWAFAVLLVGVVLATTRSKEPRLTE